ncbi:MAG: hypothetical protein ABI599_05065, partial [Flavobacteriales bacterium]
RSKDDTSRGKDNTLRSKDDTSRGKDNTLRSKDNTLRSKDDTSRGKDNTLRSKDNTLSGKDHALRAKHLNEPGKHQNEVLTRCPEPERVPPHGFATGNAPVRGHVLPRHELGPTLEVLLQVTMAPS